MVNEEQPKMICTSVFKSGESTTSKEIFTEIWIKLINRLEKDKSIIGDRKPW